MLEDSQAMSRRADLLEQQVAKNVLVFVKTLELVRNRAQMCGRQLLKLQQ
jgi:hypothetical protein